MKRTPMRRNKPLRQRRREGADLEREPKPAALLPTLRPLSRGTYGGTTTGPAPKGPTAKPGKRQPTEEEKRWLSAIVQFGCVACWLDGSPSRPCAVHHILRGGQRMGHLWSLPLCDPGHHQQGQGIGLISRHPWKPRFEAKYGTEMHLLNTLQDRLGFPMLEMA